MIDLELGGANIPYKISYIRVCKSSFFINYQPETRTFMQLIDLSKIKIVQAPQIKSKNANLLVRDFG